MTIEQILSSYKTLKEIHEGDSTTVRNGVIEKVEGPQKGIAKVMGTLRGRQANTSPVNEENVEQLNRTAMDALINLSKAGDYELDSALKNATELKNELKEAAENLKALHLDKLSSDISNVAAIADTIVDTINIKKRERGDSQTKTEHTQPNQHSPAVTVTDSDTERDEHSGSEYSSSPRGSISSRLSDMSSRIKASISKANISKANIQKFINDMKIPVDSMETPVDPYEQYIRKLEKKIETKTETISIDPKIQNSETKEKYKKELFKQVNKDASRYAIEIDGRRFVSPKEDATTDVAQQIYDYLINKIPDSQSAEEKEQQVLFVMDYLQQGATTNGLMYALEELKVPDELQVDIDNSLNIIQDTKAPLTIKLTTSDKPNSPWALEITGNDVLVKSSSNPTAPPKAKAQIISHFEMSSTTGKATHDVKVTEIEGHETNSLS